MPSIAQEVTEQALRGFSTSERQQLSQLHRYKLREISAVLSPQFPPPRSPSSSRPGRRQFAEGTNDYNRYQNLANQGAVPQQQLDAAKAAYDVAQAQKNVALQGVQQVVQSAIAQAEASLKDAQLQLSYTNIVAPASGQVARKTVEVGQRVQPGSPLMAIVENNYWITANFKETQLRDIKPGQEVEITLDAFPSRKFVGRVDSISPAFGAQFALLPPDNATGNFTKVVQHIPVKVVFDSKSIQGYESRITPGMSAKVRVALRLSCFLGVLAMFSITMFFIKRQFLSSLS